MNHANCCLCRREENSRLTKGGNQRQGKSIQDSLRWTKCGHWIVSSAFVVADAKYIEPGSAGKVLDPANIICMPTLTSIIDFFLQGRGERGVFDLEELVDILKGEKVAKNSFWTFLTIWPLPQLRDIVVIRVPEERQYCDFMIVATGRNTRHVKWVSLLSSYQLSFSSLPHHLDLVSPQLNTISTLHYPLTSQCRLLRGPLSLQEQNEFFWPCPQKVPHPNSKLYFAM